MGRELVVEAISELLRKVDDDERVSVLNEAMTRLQRPKGNGKSLKLVGTIDIPASTDAWTAQERFKKDPDTGVRVKISALGKNFGDWFGRSVVDARVGSALNCHALEEDMEDWDIINELGGIAKVEVSLGEAWSFMEQYAEDKARKLLGDFRIFLFYVRSADKVLRLIDVGWSPDGWSVAALVPGVKRGEGKCVIVPQPTGQVGGSLQS